MARQSHGCPDLVLVTTSRRLHQIASPSTNTAVALHCGMQIPYSSCPYRFCATGMLTGHLVMSSGHSCGSIEAGCSHTLQQQKAEISLRNNFRQHQATSPREPPHCPYPQAVFPKLPSVPGEGLVTCYLRSAKVALIKAAASFQRAEITASAQRQLSKSTQLPSNSLAPLQVDTNPKVGIQLVSALRQPMVTKGKRCAMAPSSWQDSGAEVCWEHDCCTPRREPVRGAGEEGRGMRKAPRAHNRPLCR